MRHKKPLYFIFTIIAIAVGTIIPFVSSGDWFLAAFVLILYSLLLLSFHRLYNLLNWTDPTVLFVASYVTFIGAGIAMSGYYHIALTPFVILSSIVGLSLFIGGAVTFDIFTTPSGRIRISRPASIIATYHPWETIWAWLFLFIGIFVLLYYYYSIGTIPLLSENAESVRLMVKAGRGYLPIAGFAFLCVSSAALIAIYIRRGRVYFFIVSFVTAMIALLLLGVGYRVLTVRILLNGFIVYSFVKKSKMSGVALIAFAIATVSLLSMVGFYRLSGYFVQSLDQVEFALRRSIYAICVRYLYIFNIVVAYFPDLHPFMLGQSYLISAGAIMPGHQPHFGFWLTEHLGLAFSSPGPVDPTILGEFYANFGQIGIVIGMFALGAGLRALYRLLEVKPPLPINRLVLMTLLSTSLMGMVTSGIVLVVLFDTLPLMAVFAAYQLCMRLSWSVSQSGLISARSASVNHRAKP